MFKMMYQWIRIKLEKEDGMEMLQVILISGIALVLIITIFFPQMKTFFGSMMTTITDWFSSKGSEPFK